MADETNWKAGLTSRDLEKRSYTSDENGNVARNTVTGGLTIGKYDEVQITYPNDTQEVYQYIFQGTTVSTVTLTYVDKNKRDLQSIIRT